MTENKQYSFNVNKNTIEFDGKFKAYVNIVDGQRIVDLLNELSDECDFLKIENEALEDGATKYAELYHKSLKENKQLKKDNTDLMMVLKNQSIIIQELYSKLLEYELKEPKESIVLTKEDLEIMGKAISYYTHERCGE